jgi:hypothetical protein
MHFNCLTLVEAILEPKRQLSIFFVSYFAAKLLHLGSHASSLPLFLYLLYFPTFILQDIVLLVSSKLLLYRDTTGQSSLIRKSFGGLLA